MFINLYLLAFGSFKDPIFYHSTSTAIVVWNCFHLVLEITMKRLPHLQPHAPFTLLNSNWLKIHNVVKQQTHRTSSTSTKILLGLRAGELLHTSPDNEEHDSDNDENYSDDVDGENHEVNDIIVTFRNELKQMREELEREAEMEIEATKRMIQRKTQREQEQQELQKIRRYKEHAERTRKHIQNNEEHLQNTNDGNHGNDEQLITEQKGPFHECHSDQSDDHFDDNQEGVHSDETCNEEIIDHKVKFEQNVKRKDLRQATSPRTGKSNTHLNIDETEVDDAFIVGDTDEYHDDVIEKLMIDEQQEHVPTGQLNVESTRHLDHTLKENLAKSNYDKFQQESSSSLQRNVRVKKTKKKRKRKNRRRHKKRSKYHELTQHEARKLYDNLISDDYMKSEDEDSLTLTGVIMRSFVPTLVLAILLFLSHVVFDALLKRI